MIDFSKLQIDKLAQQIIFTFLGLGFVAICGSVGIALIKSSSFTYSDGQTNINIDTNTAKKVKSNSNNLEYANKKLQEKLRVLEMDMLVLKDTYSDNPEIKPVLDYVDESVQKLEPVTKEINKSTEKLKQVADGAIQENSQKID